MNKSLILLLCIIGLCTCKEAPISNYEIQHDIDITKYEQTKNLFRFIDSGVSGLNFNNFLKEEYFQNTFYYEYSFNGGGVGIADLDNDGLQDVVMTSTVEQNKIFKNLGNMKFSDVSLTSGINNKLGFNAGIAIVDLNSDGLLDLVISRSGNLTDASTRANQLFINLGGMKFIEKAAEYGIADISYTTQSYFADFDLDGDLDLYMLNHPVNWGKNDRLHLDKNNREIKDTTRQFVSDRLYINTGGKFIDKTFEYKVGNIAFGLSAIIADFNGDNYPDVYVANDYVNPDQFMINHGGKYFTDEVHTYFKNISTTSMGSDVFDANNDGMLDIFVNDMMPESSMRMRQTGTAVNYDIHLVARNNQYHDQFRYNTFQLANEYGKFSNIAHLTGTARTEWSWAALGADFDHNNYEDIFISNGYLFEANNLDFKMFQVDSLKKAVKKDDFFKSWLKLIKRYPTKNYLYSNNGSLQFDDASAIWNSGEASYSNGAAYGDLDNDGDLDLIVNNLNQSAFLMENTMNERKISDYLYLTLKGDKENIWALGAQIYLSLSDGTKMTRVFNPIRGFMSTCEYRVHFGLKKNQQITNLEVKWPGGKFESFGALPTNQLHKIEKGKGKPSTKTVNGNAVFAEKSLNWKHKENDYIDFKREPLLHMKNSVNGPTIAVGDVNGDGLDDIYLGGSSGQTGSIAIQSISGEFSMVSGDDFKIDSLFEDEASQFGDIDGDGDHDLVVASGGYQWDEGSNHYKLRLYLNDGKGQFTKNTTMLPNLSTNTNSLKLFDFDNDKDLDIFVGGGPIPNQYPVGGKSYLLRNDKSKFIDISSSLEGSASYGIVKDVETLDFDKDGFLDLVIAGDYQPVRLLKNSGSAFKDISLTAGFDKTNGLWQEIYIEDVDQDGNKDIICGNLGLNSFFKASLEKPTCIYSGDFDENKEHDAILCTYFGNQSYPVHSRDELLSHMTKLRKKYLRNNPYSVTDINNLFDNVDMSKADRYYAYTFESSIFYNNNGKFSRLALPLESQMSMVNGISIIEKNGSRYLITSGNFWDTDFDYGKYDASIGAVYSISGKTLNTIRGSGFIADSNIREQEIINIKGRPAILICGNNESPRIFQ